MSRTLALLTVALGAYMAVLVAELSGVPHPISVPHCAASPDEWLPARILGHPGHDC
jgi:hypothetical protein